MNIIEQKRLKKFEIRRETTRQELIRRVIKIRDKIYYANSIFMFSNDNIKIKYLRDKDKIFFKNRVYKKSFLFNYSSAPGFIKINDLNSYIMQLSVYFSNDKKKALLKEIKRIYAFGTFEEFISFYTTNIKPYLLFYIRCFKIKMLSGHFFVSNSNKLPKLHYFNLGKIVLMELKELPFHISKRNEFDEIIRARLDSGI